MGVGVQVGDEHLIIDDSMLFLGSVVVGVLEGSGREYRWHGAELTSLRDGRYAMHANA